MSLIIKKFYGALFPLSIMNLSVHKLFADGSDNCSNENNRLLPIKKKAFVFRYL